MRSAASGPVRGGRRGRGLDLDLAPGTVTGLIGPNGAGKTTALEAISGLVAVGGRRPSVSTAPLERLPAHRRARLGLARTFQSQELFEDLTVAENLLVAGGTGTATNGSRPLTHAERRSWRWNGPLAGRPEVLLLDEPAAGLDDAGRAAWPAGSGIWPRPDGRPARRPRHAARARRV